VIGTVLLCFAFVFACIAAFVMQGYGRTHFGWLAVMFYFASLLFGQAGHLLLAR
jgi:hypothetical protein